MAGYRSPDEPVPEPPDAELVVASELHRRADRIRRLVLVPSLLSGLGLGVVGYFALRELFFVVMHAHQPYVTGLLTVLPSFIGSLRGARWLSDAVVRSRLDGWIVDLATAHGVSREALDDHARIIRGHQ